MVKLESDDSAVKNYKSDNQRGSFLDSEY